MTPRNSRSGSEARSAERAEFELVHSADSRTVGSRTADPRSEVSESAEADRQQERIRQEVERYRECVDVHELPEIYQLWSERWVLPKLVACGFDSLGSFFLDQLLSSCHAGAPTRQLFVSLGAGNCDLELGLARQLLERGVKHFHFQCIELNPHMIERAQAAAEEAGIASFFTFDTSNLDDWQPDPNTSVVIANHSLHHIVELEVLFAKIKTAIGNHGLFLANDMIGRNGHMRWPEAEALLQPIWQRMLERYKYNHQLERFEPQFVNWDCSQEGFEGIRAQDILPLLIEEFHFASFVAFGNLADVFVDRSFGHNFDPSNSEDVTFVESVARLDETKIDAGEIKPTHMIAAMRGSSVSRPRFYRHWSPEFCLRTPDEPYRRCAGEKR